MCKTNSEISEWFRKFRNDFESSEWFPSSEWFDLHNNSKHFVIPSTFGIFSKSARNAAETPDSEHRKETGNDYMWKHPPSAFPALPTCNKLLPNLLLIFFLGKSLLFGIEIFY